MFEIPVLENLDAIKPSPLVGAHEIAGTLPARRVYVETYGCQMNVADSEIVLGVLNDSGYSYASTPDSADVILLNTCSIRERAEEKIYHRLTALKGFKRRNPDLVVGILGCMAERLRKELIEDRQIVDLVCGPDEYRKLPDLLDGALHGSRGIAVKLSRVETYDNIMPLRTEGISAWISVMRGCDKFCTFCVVPFTRGRERSRTLDGVVHEVRTLAERGVREVTLLGQNVNSYRDGDTDFADLLAAVARVDRRVRVRYTTSNPQDLSDKLIATMLEHENICEYIHLPVQSGSDAVLERMNRQYSREHYLRLVDRIRLAMPDVALSTDIIAGFCGETEEDHQATLDLMRRVRYDGAYMFKYSPREGTKAFEFGDDVAEVVKTRRLNEIISLQQSIARERNDTMRGTTVDVLVEGPSRKTDEEWCGRTDTNKVVVFPRADAATGDYRRASIETATSATLFGALLPR